MGRGKRGEGEREGESEHNFWIPGQQRGSSLLSHIEKKSCVVLLGR